LAPYYDNPLPGTLYMALDLDPDAVQERGQ
jgi:hypothetical protein